MKELNRKAFTLLEVNISMGIAIMLIMIVITFGIHKVVEGSSYNRLTYSSVNNDVNSALRNAMSGYGGKSISEGINDEKTLLPQDFMVFFRSSIENDNISGHYYLVELQKREFNNTDYTRVIDKKKIEYKAPDIYLKTIKLKENEGDTGVDVQSFAISFRNPTGKTNFYVNENSFIEEGKVVLSDDSINTINEVITPSENLNYNIAELYFYGGDGKKKFTYKIHKDKQFYISLDK